MSVDGPPGDLYDARIPDWWHNMPAKNGLTGRANFDAFALPLPAGLVTPREELLDRLADLQFSLQEAIELVEDERTNAHLRTMYPRLRHLYDEINVLLMTVPDC